MNLHIKCAAIALVGGLLTLFIPAPALAYSSAPLTFCNRTAVADVNLAYGYHSPGVHDPADHSVLTGLFVSRGWVIVKPGECRTIPNPFDARYMFWFAATAGVNDNGSTVLPMRNADVPEHFCVNNYLSGADVPEFTYEDENESADACDKDGSIQAHNLWVTPQVVDTWVDATVNFTELPGRATPTIATSPVDERIAGVNTQVGAFSDGGPYKNVLSLATASDASKRLAAIIIRGPDPTKEDDKPLAMIFTKLGGTKDGYAWSQFVAAWEKARRTMSPKKSANKEDVTSIMIGSFGFGAGLGGDAGNAGVDVSVNDDATISIDLEVIGSSHQFRLQSKNFEEFGRDVAKVSAYFAN